MNIAVAGATLLVIVGGIVVQIYRARQAPRVCPNPPNVRALQLSCLATQALGVEFYLAQETGWGILFILAGVCGLGALSLSCDCRDDAFAQAPDTE